jgi:hypothetical protein
MKLAMTLGDRAQSLDPSSKIASSIKQRLQGYEMSRRLQQLSKMTSPELTNLSAHDRLLLTLFQMEKSPEKAQEVLALAAQNREGPLYGPAIYHGNIVLGKLALRRGDKSAATRYLLAAAEAPSIKEYFGHPFEMNLPRALVDWGQRSAVADFLDRMAEKTETPQQLHDWAKQIRHGINPDLLPTFSYPNCTKGPC